MKPRREKTHLVLHKSIRTACGLFPWRVQRATKVRGDVTCISCRRQGGITKLELHEARLVPIPPSPREDDWHSFVGRSVVDDCTVCGDRYAAHYMPEDA